ncbi:S41 family peptidase [Fodinisporobacter ferrooxydans]|uniref:S41 family peptidase n=1 Tax=Fodinisporobacter ferrooxydans TaxID=2901836 RepID=A0ABY4CQ44_9BACL|nr:S41 family peptidase [Alicyclobacillaceae bacterium MYW30-H2]
MYIKKRTLAVTMIATIVLSSAATALAIKEFNVNQVPMPPANSQSEATEIQKFFQVYHMLRDRYVDKESPDTLLNGAINGMVQSLNDPFSTYMDPKAAAKFNDMIQSSFEGIGAVMESDNGKIVVASVFKDSPAEKAGLKAKDQILSVNGKSLQGIDVDKAAMMIRGPKGTKVTLDVERPSTSQKLQLSIVRAAIKEDTVFSKQLGNGMGYIQITQFSENTAKEFDTQLQSLEKQGIKGLVIDLRQDPGGLLDSVKTIADELIPKGKTILQVENRNGQKDVYKSDKGTVNLPIVGLVDGGSASAAEILSAALHESGGYPLVGEKTFGKGTVQTTQPYSDGSSVKYTIAKWLTPDGNWIHKKGIMPEYVVHLPSYFNLPVLTASDKLKYDMNNDQVKAAQQMLLAIGFDPGREDGYFSKQTEQAVSDFQKAKGLQADGIIQGQTINALMDALREKMKQDDTQLKMAEDVLQKEINSRK